MEEQEVKYCGGNNYEREKKVEGKETGEGGIINGETPSNPLD